MHVTGQSGKGNLGCILGLVILAVGVVVAFKVAPVKVAVAELEAFCERQAEGASLPRNSDEAIAGAILAKAKSLNLPLKGEDLKVWRDGTNVHVELKYRVVIELPFYTYNWDVKHNIERVLF